MGMRCCYVGCNSDYRYPDRLNGGRVKFIPFPKPKSQYKKCVRWVSLCGTHIKPEGIARHHYVCTKHFVDKSGPTPEFPDPVPVNFQDAEYAKAIKMRRSRTSKRNKAVEQNPAKPDQDLPTENKQDAENERQACLKGNRLINLGTLLDNLRWCQKCGRGPVPLSSSSVKGEHRVGLGGYLFVQCGSRFCQAVNKVAYSQMTQHTTDKGKQIPCFDVNTKLTKDKLGRLGGLKGVNEVLTTLDLGLISLIDSDNNKDLAGGISTRLTTEPGCDGESDTGTKKEQSEPAQTKPPQIAESGQNGEVSANLGAPLNLGVGGGGGGTIFIQGGTPLVPTGGIPLITGGGMPLISGGGTTLTQGAGTPLFLGGGAPVMLGGNPLVLGAGGTILSQVGGAMLSQGGGTPFILRGGTQLSQSGGTVLCQGLGTTLSQVGGTTLNQSGGAPLVLGGGTQLSQAGGTALSQGGGTPLILGGGTQLPQAGGTTLSQGLGTPISQVGGTTHSQVGGTPLILGEGTALSQGGGTALSQGLGTRLSQGGGTQHTLGAGTKLSQAGGTTLSQGGAPTLSQGGGTPLILGGRTQLSQGGGMVLSQGLGTKLSQAGGTILGQGGGIPLILGGGTQLPQSGGTALSQGLGTTLSQGAGTPLSLGAGTKLSQVVGTTLSQGGETRNSQGGAPALSQGSAEGGGAGGVTVLSKGGGLPVLLGGGFALSVDDGKVGVGGGGGDPPSLGRGSPVSHGGETTGNKKDVRVGKRPGGTSINDSKKIKMCEAAQIRDETKSDLGSTVEDRTKQTCVGTEESLLGVIMECENGDLEDEEEHISSAENQNIVSRYVLHSEIRCSGSQPTIYESSSVESSDGEGTGDSDVTVKCEADDPECEQRLICDRTEDSLSDTSVKNEVVDAKYEQHPSCVSDTSVNGKAVDAKYEQQHSHVCDSAGEGVSYIPVKTEVEDPDYELQQRVDNNTKESDKLNDYFSCFS